jgi:hypothetical protein
MRPVPPKGLRQVQQFLASSAPPYDFAAHFETLAPEAVVLIGSQAVSLRDLSQDMYVRRMQQFQEMAGSDSFGAGFSLAIVQDWLPDADGGILLAGIKETATKANLSVLFRLQGEKLQIRAAVIGGKPLPKPDQVIARSLAEVAHWRPTTDHDVWPLHSLGLGWLRRQAVPSEPLLALPEARFTCQNTGFCCSKVGSWEVAVHSNAMRAISATPWEGLHLPGPRFRPAKHGDAQRTDTEWALDGCADGGCAAHVNGGCSVHRAAGWQPIEPCLVFPYQFVATPDGICVTCSFICHSVGGNAGAPLLQQEADVRNRLQAVRSLVTTLPDQIPLVRGGAVMTWEAYKRLEDVLLDLLADRTRGPLPERLVAAHQLMVAIMTVFRYARAVDRAAIDHVLGTPLPDIALVPAQFADELMQRLLKPMAHPAPLRPDVLFGDWHAKGWAMGRGKPLHDALDDEMVTRYLRTILYRKLGLADAGAAFIWSTVTWAFRAWERQARFLESVTGRPVDRALQLDVARHVDTQLLGSHLLTTLSNTEAAYQRFVSPRFWLSLAEA